MTGTGNFDLMVISKNKRKDISNFRWCTCPDELVFGSFVRRVVQGSLYANMGCDV